MSFHCTLRILIPALLVALPAPAQTSELFDHVENMLAGLAEITGWQVKREIPSEILSHAEFAKIIEEGIQAAEDDKDVRAVELTLKMFGLAPWDYNLARESGELIEEQAAAFYDFKKKRLFVLDTTPDGPEQRIALAHELAHALADQHYSLRKYMDGAKTDDAATARQAVIEGQAMWLSWAYFAMQTTGKPEVPPFMIERLSASVGGTGEDFPVLARTPLYIRESLTFPYTAGMKFQDAAFRKLGNKAFDALFQAPPGSTREIMHPERYQEGPSPTSPRLWDLKSALGKEGGQFKKLVSGDVGEFDYAILLRQYTDEKSADTIAPHWRGGSYALYEHKKEKYPLLVHTAEWDSPEAARQFFESYQEILRGKWKYYDVTSEPGPDLAGLGDSGKFLLRLQGASVQVIEGMGGPGQEALTVVKLERPRPQMQDTNSRKGEVN